MTRRISTIWCGRSRRSGRNSGSSARREVRDPLEPAAIELLAQPALLERLYRPFWYDRHREHAPDEPSTFAAPVFEYDGALKARLALLEIGADYTLRGETMDDEAVAALAALRIVFDRPELRVELDFQPGQIQLVNNRATGHARTHFVDDQAPEWRRQLIRLWLHDRGGRAYRG
ncbi:MAG TPA: TauD/TfdA family dioxygenase [Stellaceae bacterium]|nr:TauD/TfdA family dioxygenase [Stellaceae bacterium]